jgi:catalase (peroxidase I)
MASMLRDVNESGASPINVDALKSEIRNVLINQKANACPMAVRVSWHSAGTYDKKDGSGGSNGATIRFPPESTDGANAGLSIIRDLLLPVKNAHPEISFADLHTIAGCMAVEFLGGPKVPFNFGRTDEPDGKKCPPNGRLPDASKGAQHLREVFQERMGFTDREIVALSGGHTLGRCHKVRSGFDGPWTTHPLRFDNEYYLNLLHKTWVPRKWDGPLQYEDKETGKLMMLPTDLALLEDPKFKAYVEEYAQSEATFFKDFAQAYGKLLSLGCPAHCQPQYTTPQPSEKDSLSAEFRELAMHGSVLPCKALASRCDVHQVEATSGRSALHKAAFWGHIDMVRYLVHECKLNLNLQDHYGDTPLHDAAKFGHEEVAKILLEAGANTSIKNNSGKDARAVAQEHNKTPIVNMIKAH